MTSVMSSSRSGSLSPTPREHAALVMNKVDVIITSNQNRRDMLSSIAHQFDASATSTIDIADIDTTTADIDIETDTSDSTSSTASTGTSATSTAANTTTNELPNIDTFTSISPNTKVLSSNTSLLTPDNHILGVGTTTLQQQQQQQQQQQPSTGAGTKKKLKSSTTIHELKRQLQDCHNALLTMRENANLKYSKLELDFAALTTSMSQVQLELELEIKTSQQLRMDKAQLQKQLQTFISMDDQQKTTKQITTPAAADACLQCQRLLQTTQHQQQQVSTKGLWGNLVLAAKEIDPSLGSEERLWPTCEDKNAPRSVNTVPTLHQPPPEMFISVKPTPRNKNDMDATLVAPKDDTTLKSPWNRISNGVQSQATEKSTKKKSRNKKKKDYFGSLDDFFGVATAGLVNEEMDDEKSFFSRQRSVSTMPEKSKKKKKKIKEELCTSDSEQAKEAVEAKWNDGKGRRALMKVSLQARMSFRSRLLGLGAETMPHEESFAFVSSRNLWAPKWPGTDIAESSQQKYGTRSHIVDLDRTDEDMTNI